MDKLAEYRKFKICKLNPISFRHVGGGFFLHKKTDPVLESVLLVGHYALRTLTACGPR